MVNGRDGEAKLPENRLIDKYSRKLNYLRLSITDRCNLRCAYCVPHTPVRKFLHSEILRYEEILRIVRVLTGLGIRKVRVTGGEPLVRKGVYDFMTELCRVEGLEEVSLTTNAVLLEQNIEAIHAAGISRINVSLDTLNPEKYKKITGVDMLPRVMRGLAAARERGLSPIKINAVAMRGVNDDEIEELARLSLTQPYHVRFIEYMPIGNRKADSGDNPLLAPEIQERLGRVGKLIPVERGGNDGPAQRFRYEGAAGEVGLIRPMSHHFCSTCNRLRLTANGQLRTCLLSDRQEDIKGPLRSGASDAELADLIVAAARLKPLEHHVAISGPSEVSSQMSSIGG